MLIVVMLIKKKMCIIEATLFFDVRCATSIWFLWKLSILESSVTLQISTEFSFLPCTGILDNASMKLDLMYCAFSFSFSLTALSSSLTFLIVEFSNAFSSFRWLFKFLMSAGSDICSSNFSDMNFMLTSRSSTLESVILSFSFINSVCILNFSLIFQNLSWFLLSRYLFHCATMKCLFPLR